MADNQFIARNGLIALDDSQITGSLSLTGAVTGSIFSGSFVGDGSQLSGVTTASYVEYSNVANKPTLVSGSSQITYSGLSGIPSGIVSGSSQISYPGLSNIPSGIVSGSSQVSFNGIVDKPTLVSGSSQITYSGLTGIPSGIVSGSSQITYSGLTGIPSGIVSGSSQVSYTGLSNIPSGIVSGSTQVAALGFATTGSNTFQANQTITGSLFISQNLIVAGSSSIQYISSSVVDIADNIITVNAFNPGVRFGGLAVADSGSSPRVSGSILFDSIKDQWIFVHEAPGAITSSVVLMGPETYNDLGNETYISANRLPKGTGIEHLRDSNITDTGTIVSINSNTQVTGSLNVSGGVTGSFSGALSGNATTATTLQTARTIGGVSFNGSANIDLPGVNTAGNQNTSGNAASATVLQTARTIGGVSFNGSANIDLPGVNTAGNQNTSGNAATATSAATWTTGRTITIGSTGKSVNGSANVSWSLAEIGAQAALNGTGFVKISGTTISYDNSTYLTGNQTITLSGDASGSGTTSIAATVNRLTYQGDYANNDVGTTRGPAGLSLRGVYANGYPTTYGNILHLRGGGAGQLLIGWSGTDGAHADNYIRSKRDNDSGAWSPWAKVWTDVNLTNLNQLTNGPGYITGYTETDTLSSVVSRGSSTSTGITINPNGTSITMGGGASAEGIRMQASTSTTYPVFLRSLNPSGGGETSAWLFKEDSTPWGIWHNNPVNSIDFTRASTTGIENNVGGGTNTVMIRLNQTDGSGQFTGNILNRVGSTILDQNGSIPGNAGTVTNGVYTTGNQTISGEKTFSSRSIFNGNILVSPVSSAWAEGLAFTMPSTSTWGGLRWRRERGNADGNWYIGFTALDSSDDLVFGANNGGAQVDNILRMRKNGNIIFGSSASSTAKVSICSTVTNSTVLDVQGCAGQLFSVTDNLVGEIFAVSDISGIPILSVNSNGTVSVDSKIAVGANHTVSGAYASVLGGVCNTANESGGTLPLGYVGGTGGFVGGGTGNLASGQGSVVVGGVPVDVTITACSNNIASGLSSFVGAGAKNCASGCGAAVVGGGCVGGGAPGWGPNIASGTNSFIGGGSSNCASGTHSVVAGGGGPNFLSRGNTASGCYSAILGGMSNSACSYLSTVVGGGLNTASSYYSTVGGGRQNCASGNFSTVAGGFQNTASAYGAVVAGGGSCGGGNSATARNSTISGGSRNTASGCYSTVSGGRNNTASGFFSTVGGGAGQAGLGNCASGFASTVAGGFNNTASNYCATVGGGGFNTASGYRSTVGGGVFNTASGFYSTVSGGYSNTACHACSVAANNNQTTSSSCQFRVNNLSKASGTFRITHPDPSKKHTHYLSHSFVESPNAGDNIYRYKVNVINGTAVINLPSYYKYLNENDQIWVTPQGHFGIGYGTVNAEQTQLTIYGNTDGEYNVLLIGTRKDFDAVHHWQGVETYK